MTIMTVRERSRGLTESTEGRDDDDDLDEEKGECDGSSRSEVTRQPAGR